MTLFASNLALVKCLFENNVGTGFINATNGNITIVQGVFKNNNYAGSANNSEMFSCFSCNITIVSSTFIDNDGKLLFVRKLNYDASEMMPLTSTLTFIGCEFRNNRHNLSRLIDVHNSDMLLICDIQFISNKMVEILYAKESVVKADNCTFKHNHGSAMLFDNCKVDIFNSVFNNNEARAALRLRNTTVHIHGCEFKENINAGSYWRISRGGAIFSSDKTIVRISEICTFTGNQAEKGGAIHIEQNSQCFIENGATMIIANNTALDGIYQNYIVSGNGGGIYLDSHSNLTLKSQSTLQIVRNNASADGGGIYLIDYSNIILHSRTTLQILENSAMYTGGGIYTALSSINLRFNPLNDSSQTSDSTTFFYRNQARNGGGLYLGSNSIVHQYYGTPVLCHTNIYFVQNLADYGGAVYVFAEITSETQYSDTELCFFQTLHCRKQDEPFYFSLNTAKYSGSSLYKIAFDNCSMGETSYGEFELLHLMSNIRTSDIGSTVVQVCYCDNGLPDYSKQISYMNIKIGEKLILYVAIADRGNHIVSGSIMSKMGGSMQIRDDQNVQNVTNGCTPLIFNIIYSIEGSQQLTMIPVLKKGSKHRGLKRSIEINFLACISCPIGFQQIEDDTKGCDCVCDEIIDHCNYTRETITKKDTTAWITYLSVENASGYVVYPYCPMDYCLPRDTAIEINLNIPNGSDVQCALNRSGLLCGTCSLGLSLSLGSSRCLQCHAYWPGVLIVIIISGLLSGFLLVAALLVLNLTVAVGTLNGLIFYANIVAANQYKFFPPRSFVTVFVSWLNLELGVDTCFFDGMDFYWKTWIQLAFPAYLLLLVALVIIASEYSIKFSQIIGKRNPIATLDTLILLCYVKFLRTVIVVFSFTTLDYPDGSRPRVWWPDATIRYFSGKHIVLWIVAAIIFLAGLFYTILLLLWQWLLYYQHKIIFKWIQSRRLRFFVEPYHAPYSFKHRYWTGMLLLIRVVVHGISASDVSGDRGITVLAIGIIAIIVLSFVSCRPYKSWVVEILEIVSYANIAGLCLATFYTSQVGKGQDVVGYISGIISLILFLVILTYHVVTQLTFLTQLGNKLKNRFTRGRQLDDLDKEVSLVSRQASEEGKSATHSEIDPPPRIDVAPRSRLNLRSRRDSEDSVSVNALPDYEENELKPIGRKIIDSSTPYSLIK